MGQNLPYRCPMTQPTQRPPVIPLAYQSPPPHPPVSWGIWVAYFMLWPSLALILTLGCLFIVPKFEKIFLDFKVQLPAATVLLVSFSRWFTSGYGWMVDWGTALAAAFAMAFATWRGRDLWRVFRITRRITYVVLMLVLVGSAWPIVAPMIALIQAISGN